MAEIKNAMEIFTLLEKSNCRECDLPTCLAFAAAVFKGERAIGDCPRLDADVLARFEGGAEKQKRAHAQEEAAALEKMKGKIAATDLSAAAIRLGVTYAGNQLVLRCLGKELRVDAQGNFITDIHVHAWILGPVVNYILHGRGRPLSGKWVPLRELAGGKEWQRFFRQRCEKPFKQLADSYTQLFEDMIRLFNGRQVENHYTADISLVIEPLPGVPILFCYWKPDDGLASDLNIFFDRTAADNLPMESLYTLGTGLAIMFEKIARRHGSP